MTDEALTSTPTTRPQRRKYSPGDRFGSLALVEYVQASSSGSLAVWRCDCGQSRTLAVRNVSAGRTATCGDRARHPRRKAQPAYSTAHHRVAVDKGPASRHPCVRCGAPARDWAYTYSDLDQQADDGGKDAGRYFSGDPAHYVAMCRRHHQAYDQASRAHIVPGYASLVHVALHVARQAASEDSESTSDRDI